MNRKQLGVGIAAAFSLAAAAVPAAPASATIYERLRAVDEPTIPWSYDDCGPAIAVEGVFNGRVIIKQGTGPKAGTFPVLDRFSLVETHTNTLTGASFTVRVTSVFNEVQARRVEGDVFEFTAVETGQPMVVEDADGRVVLRDRGAVRYTFLFDTGGDDVPGGTYLTDFLPADPHAPRPSWTTDWCALALDLTSPE